MSESIVVNIKDLEVNMMTVNGIVMAVRGVNLDIKKGEIHGIVGESGCGKSMMVKSIMRLHDESKTEYNGEIKVMGKSVLDMSSKQLLDYRGKDVSMIFQNPMTSLNPIMKTGEQIAEVLKVKHKISKKEARKKVIEMFEKVGITPAEKRYEQYPYEMSGGLIQRVVIAMAIICNPKLIIADEPTTALDVTIQAQILELMKEVRKEFGASIIFITHDLGVIAEICDRISVMYAGRIIETGNSLDIFDHPSHPYTKALLASNPYSGDTKERMTTIPGTPPSLYKVMEGCSFCDRCSYTFDKCKQVKPNMIHIDKEHYAECHIADVMYKESLKDKQKGASI